MQKSARDLFADPDAERRARDFYADDIDQVCLRQGFGVFDEVVADLGA